jgi:hypothetical protein
MCKYLMLLMAAVAALLTVLVVATGGAALGAMMAAGAVAGAAGGAAGTVMGGLICGQKAALARTWLGSKNNFIIGGQPTLTTEHQMVCALMGGTIKPIPAVKNFWQATALGLGNWVSEMLQCVMAGAAIGAVGEILVLGPGVFFEGAVSSLVTNVVSTWTTGVGLGIRGLMGYSAGVKAKYEQGLSDEEVLAESGKGFVGMELGTYESVRRICTGQGTIMDAAGILLWFSPAGKSRQSETKTKESKPSEEAKANEEAQARARQEAISEEPPAPDGEAYEGAKNLEGYDLIKKFREKAGLDPYSAKSGDTVAMLDVNGRKFFGVNSRLSPASLPLRRTWFEKIEWQPTKAKKPDHMGRAQSMTHAEAHSLLRAKERLGSLPEKLEMYVDRVTCNQCIGELPAILKAVGVKELTVYSGGNTAPRIIYAAQ